MSGAEVFPILISCFCANIDVFLAVGIPFIAELHARAKRARVGGAPLLRKSTHPRKFGNHVTDRPTDRPTVRPHHRHTNVYSHFLATLGAQEKADCTSMLSAIDSCQNRVSADHYHLTESRAQVSTHRGRVFF